MSKQQYSKGAVYRDTTKSFSQKFHKIHGKITFCPSQLLLYEIFEIFRVVFSRKHLRWTTSQHSKKGSGLKIRTKNDPAVSIKHTKKSPEFFLNAEKKNIKALAMEPLLVKNTPGHQLANSFSQFFFLLNPSFVVNYIIRMFLCIMVLSQFLPVEKEVLLANRHNA